MQRDQPVKLSSLIDGWKLYKSFGCEIGAPEEAFTKLFAVRGEVVHILRDSSSLRGHVAITSPSQALELVRLFTSVDTFYVFEDSAYIEVVAADERGFGTVPPARFKALGLHEPRVRLTSSGFVVRRFVAERHSRSVDIHLIEESVGHDGAYSRRLIRRVGKEHDILLPAFY